MEEGMLLMIEFDPRSRIVSSVKLLSVEGMEPVML
jgi:hypothetical protein